MTTKMSKPQADWELIEKHFRAGLLSLREICTTVENAVTEGAIRKRAKRDGWTRNLEAKIQQKAQELVRKEAVRTVSTQLTAADERTVVDVNARQVAEVDLRSRTDLQAVIDTHRGLAQELALLSNADFAADLAQLGELLDQSGHNASGTWIKDKINELYRYIISLEGRVKMAKDIAAAYNVYIPMQRKIFGLDAEKANTSNVDELLKKVRDEQKAVA